MPPSRNNFLFILVTAAAAAAFATVVGSCQVAVIAYWVVSSLARNGITAEPGLGIQFSPHGCQNVSHTDVHTHKLTQICCGPRPRDTSTSVLPRGGSCPVLD